MKAFLVALFVVALALPVAAFGDHESVTEQHVVPFSLVVGGQTVTGAVTIDDPDPVPHATTSTGTTTTTNPPPTTTTEPPASGQLILPDDQPFRCTGPVDYTYVRVNIVSADVNAFQVGSGCTGRIGSIAVTTRTQDAVRILNGATGYNLLINGGFVRARGASVGAHQDGMQTIGGAGSLEMRNVVFSGVDTQYLITSSVNNGRFLCDRCTFLPEHNGLVPAHPAVNGGPANAAILVYGNSGTLNSLVCVGDRFGHGVRIDSNPNVIGWVDPEPGGYNAVPAPGSGNELADLSDPRCQASG